MLVETLAVGICGTDIEILSGAYGWAPPGRDRLVLGHESLGRVLEAPAGSDLAKGDLVVGIVRRPDPVPCANCAVGEWDFCRNGQYTERGIKEHDGYLSERYRIHPGVRWSSSTPRSASSACCWSRPAWWPRPGSRWTASAARAHWAPTTAVVTGAGPIGLLAAMIGVQRGLEVHVFDQMTEGLKPDLVAELGAHVPHRPHRGAGRRRRRHHRVHRRLVPGARRHGAHRSRAGWSASPACRRRAGRSASTRAQLNRTMVLDNEAVVGSVNANRRHYQAAADALAAADPDLARQAHHPARCRSSRGSRRSTVTPTTSRW